MPVFWILMKMKMTFEIDGLPLLIISAIESWALESAGTLEWWPPAHRPYGSVRVLSKIPVFSGE